MKTVFMILCAIFAARAEQLRITIYDDIGLHERTLGETANHLQRIFRRANIEISLSRGDPAAAENSLIVYEIRPSPLRRQQAVCLARRDIALNIVATPRGVRRGVLGMALPLSSEGLNVRVFADRVLDAAVRNERPFANVLAHVMAHEIGHVLLRTEAHESHGIMTAVWSWREYDQMTASTVMFFTREQSLRMRQTLAGGDCRQSAEARPVQVWPPAPA